MDTHHNDGGSTRRELLKRGAVAGGALLWATPVIQSLDLRAAAAQAGTEQPTPTTIDKNEKMPPPVVTTTTAAEDRPPFPPAGQAIQHLDFLFAAAGVVYGARYEAFGDGGAFVSAEKPDAASLQHKTPGCLDAFQDWTPATPELIKILNVKGTVQILGDGELRQYVVLLPPEVVVVAAFSKCGERCGPPEPWKGGLLFHPCPPETETDGAKGTGSTTTTSTTSTTSTTTTSTTAPPSG